MNFPASESQSLLATQLLAGRVAVITGAGSGIGRASAIALAAAGACVVLAGRTQSSLDAVAAEICSAGGQAVARCCDVTDPADVAAVVQRAEVNFGGLDIFLSNAGISPDGAVEDTSVEGWSECIAINLTGVFLSAKYALPALVERGGGSFLVIAGTLGLRPSSQKAAYAASKAGVISLAKSIALDYGDRKVRSNAICPGLVATPLTSHLTASDLAAYYERHQPLPGTIEATDIASAVVFLASDQGRFITGQTIVIDAGQQAGLT